MSNNTNTNVGNNNSVLGSWALYSAANDTSCNSAFGTNSLLKHTTGSFNTSIGAGSMTFNITGNRNVAVGSSALEFNTNSENNTAIGTQALFGQREGSNNTAIGINSGLNDVSGSFNTYLGADTGTNSSSNTYTKSTAIGYGATIRDSNQIVVGTGGEKVYIPGRLFVGNLTNEITTSGTGGGNNGPSTGVSSDDNNNTKLGSATIVTQSMRNSTAVGYGAIVNASNQIVLGTSAEFVCIPSNRGLSIGKTTAPTTGVGLDVSGAMIINTGLMSYNNYSFLDSSGNIPSTFILTSMPKLNISLFTNWDDQEIGLGFYNEIKKFVVDISNSKLLSTSLNKLFIRDVSINNTQTKYDVNNGFLNLSMGIRSLSNLIDNTDMTLNMLYTPMCQYNTSVGNFSQISNTTGFMNTSLGAFSMPTNIDGSNNTAIGYKSGYSDTSGYFNTYLGANTHTIDVNGIYPIYNNSTAIGYNAAIDASNQIVIGTENENVLVRGTMQVNKLLKLDNGLNLSGDVMFLSRNDNNSTIHYKLQMNNGANNAIMILDASTCSITLSGPNSVISINGSTISSFAGIGNVNDTSNNIRIGTDVLSSNIGNNNTAIGYQSLMQNETGSDNTAIGYRNLFSNKTGWYNTAIGERSLFTNQTGGYNTAIGYNAGYYADSSYNTFLGTNADIYADISSNETNIQKSTALGYEAKIDVSNQIVLGTSGEFVCIPSNRGLSIGKTTAPSYNLDVSGSINFTGEIYKNGVVFVSSSGSNNSVNDNLFVAGDISGNGNLFVAKDISGNGNLFVAKDISGNGNLFVAKDISGNSNLFVAKDISGNGNLFVANYISGNGNLFVAKDISGNGNLFVAKDISGNRNLYVGGSIYFSGDIYKGGVLYQPNNSSSSNSITGGLFVSGDISGNGKLDVTGDISGNGDLFVTGEVQAASYNATSDYRIKDNVRNLDEQDTISNLRPVKYFNKQTNKKDFGLIAHELQSEYPDLVSGEKDGAELQSVNYIGLISVLIKEVQELKRITAEQAIEIAELKSSTFRINL